MHDAVAVSRVDGPGQHLQQLGRCPRWLRRAGQVPVQAAAVHILQGNERPAVLLAHLEDLHDVGVL